jgi:hypothetical protein
MQNIKRRLNTTQPTGCLSLAFQFVPTQWWKKDENMNLLGNSGLRQLCANSIKPNICQYSRRTFERGTIAGLLFN